LVSASFLAAAVRAFAFHEAIRKEALVMLTVEHLGFLLENVPVFLDFKQGFLNKLLVNWGFGACVIVKRGFPSAEEFSYAGVVEVG
jgi:hypothetical protein